MTRYPHRDNILDFDDEDPEGEKGILAATEGEDDRPEGGDGGGASTVPEQPPQTTLMEEQHTEGFEFSTGPSVSPGVVFYDVEAAERGGADFSDRSWEPEDFGADYEQFGRTPPAAAATPSNGVPPLRATAIADPPGVCTYATLTPLPSIAIGPLARSSSLGGSSSWPPLFPIREEGGSTSAAVPAGQSVPLVNIPFLPRDITYVGAGLRRYTVPEDTFDYLGGRVGDKEHSSFISPAILLYIFIKMC
ncbi:hypothetical protein LguiA_001395 [Lonicera macranthoides]